MTLVYHYGIVNELMEAYTESIYDVPELRSFEFDDGAVISEQAELPSLACSALLMMLVEYGTCVTLLEAMELAEYCTEGTHLMNSISTHVAPKLGPGLDDRPTKRVPVQDGSRSVLSAKGALVENCLFAFKKWMPFLTERVKDQVVLGMLHVGQILWLLLILVVFLTSIFFFT